MAGAIAKLHPYKMIAVADLRPFARNARVHSEAQVKQLAAAITEWGWTNPVLIEPDGGIIAGHGRVLAAQKLGMEKIPTITIAGLTDQQRRALVIADNKLAMNSGWDDDVLRAELGDLKLAGFDLELTGFGDIELTGLFPPERGAEPDDVPEPEAVAVSRLGDVWLLGDHRITCGDSTDAATVTLALGGNKPNLMVTDPPYGVEYDADWRNHAFRSDGAPIAGRAIGVVQNDDRDDWREAWALFPGAVAYVWHAVQRARAVIESAEASGFELRSQIVWAKSSFVIGRGHYHVGHEPCLYLVRKGSTANWKGDRKQSTLWQIPKPSKSETGHSTQKPVECMARPIANHTDPGDWVYEPFSGSGTTIVAAEMAGRRCAAIELHPQYVDLAVRRWQTFTGKTATLEASGETFDAVAAKELEAV